MNILDYYIKKTNLLSKARAGCGDYEATANALNLLNLKAADHALQDFIAVEPAGHWTARTLRRAIRMASAHDPVVNERRPSIATDLLADDDYPDEVY